MKRGRWERWREHLSGAPAWKLDLAVFAAAFLVRLLYLLEIKDIEFFRVLVGDAFSYDAWARAIQQDWVGREVFYQAPLYPYFLAVVYAVAGSDPFAVRLVQAAVGAGACVLLAASGRRWFSRAIGLGAGLLLAFYGPGLFFTGLLQKTVLDLFFTSALLYCVARADEAGAPRWLGLAGATLGCLALTRENALAWLPLVAAWLAFRHRPRALAPFLLGAALVLGPVAARNAVVGGEAFVTTSQFGVNFYLGNNAEADGRYRPLRFGHGSFSQERDDAVELAEQASGRPLTPGEVSHYWSGRAWGWIAAHPGDWLELLARKWRLVWNDHEIPDSDEPLVYRDASAVLRAAWVLLSFGTLCPLAVLGLVAAWPERRRLGLLMLLLLGAAASATLFVVFGRYRAPMLPLLALFAAVGVARLVQLGRERRAREAAGAFAIIVLVAVATRFPRVEDTSPRAMAYYNLGVTLESQGELPRAAASYRASVADDPAFVEAHVNLGALLARGGDLGGAIAEETAALRAKPDDATAHTDLANALLESGRLDEAEAHYRAALRLEPDLQAARDGLSVLGDRRSQSGKP